MDDVKKSLKAAESRFSGQLLRRESVLKGSRDVISSCSKAIIDVHSGRMKDAEVELATARSLLKSLKKSSDESLSRYLISPEAEVVEASAVVALATGGEIPGMDALGSAPEAYLLGLLDTVGELKRMTLDSILKRKLREAKRYFAVMEEVYSLCTPLAVYDHVVNGARRKIDVARMLVEDTRGLLAEEMGRSAVSESMERLEKKLGAKNR